MKDNKTILVIVMILGVMAFISLTVKVSYSFVMQSSSASNVVTITTGNLSSNLSYEPVNNVIISSMSDSDGNNQSDYAQVLISKNNIYSVFYNINIGYETASVNNTANLVPLEYVKAALYSVDYSTGYITNTTPVVGPVRVADLPLYSIDTNNVFNDKYVLSFGTLAGNSQNIGYGLKVWIDSTAPDEYDGAELALGVTVEQETLVSQTFYNISGTVKDTSNNLVSGATVSLQNGLITATTNASGAFTLTNVPTGTYNLTITYSENEYNGTIHIETGSSSSISWTSPTASASGTYLQSTGYTYYTTPYKIKKANSLTTTTNEVTSTTYTAPSAIKIVGIESLSTQNISGLSLKLGSNNTIVSGS